MAAIIILTFSFFLWSSASSASKYVEGADDTNVVIFEDALLEEMMLESYQYSWNELSADLLNNWNNVEFVEEMNSHTKELSYSYDYYSGQYEGNLTSSPTDVTASDPTTAPSVQPTRPTTHPTYEDGFGIETFLPYYIILNADNRSQFGASISIFDGLLLVGSPSGYNGSGMGYIDIYDIATLRNSATEVLIITCSHFRLTNSIFFDLVLSFLFSLDKLLCEREFCQ